MIKLHLKVIFCTFFKKRVGQNYMKLKYFMRLNIKKLSLYRGKSLCIKFFVLKDCIPIFLIRFCSIDCKSRKETKNVPTQWEGTSC